MMTGMQFTIKIVAETGVVFTEMSARSLIGQTPAINTRETDDGPVITDLGRGRIVAAEVVDGGAALAVTVETERGDAPERVLSDLLGDWPGFSSMSFGFRAEDGGELHTRREDWDPSSDHNGRVL